MMNMVNGSAQSELSRFFQSLNRLGETAPPVTAAAFSKARKKFSHSAFIALNTEVTQSLYDSPFVKHWHGKRLLAVDGSTVNLPNQAGLEEHFGQLNPQAKQPSARLSQLYDVMNKLSVDVIASKVATGERSLAARHLDKADKNDLFLYDRGYPAFWLFALHVQKEVGFCARASVDFNRVIKDFVDSKEKDKVVDLQPSTPEAIQECIDRKIPLTPIKVRLIKVQLDSGEIEVLVTSLLDQESYTRVSFKKLYHQRWFVEEDYKVMKSRLEVENFTGLSVEAVLQDIHAKVLTKNIGAVAVIEADAIAQEKYKHRKRAYKINFTYVLSQLKDSIIGFVLKRFDSHVMVRFIEMISTVVNAFRPERKVERNMKKIRKKKYSMAYKRVG